jgi:hypothetical protein
VVARKLEVPIWHSKFEVTNCDFKFKFLRRNIMTNELVPDEIIENKIYLIRGQKVMLDRDLAALYDVENFQLKRQVKRNIDRFPSDFMFTLTDQEMEQMVCHFGIPSKSYFGGSAPLAFTEHGILMLSSVLNSPRAVQVNIQIMRTFTKLRRIFFGYKELKERLDQIESKYDSQFKGVFDAINEMLAEPPTKVKGVGFLK